MIAYKGMEQGMICRGYQLKMGLNITEQANCQANGFHCAANPMDCLRYYGDFQNSEYYLVRPCGDLDEDAADSKISCTQLWVLRRLEPQPNGIYGGDVPEDTCYDWAEEYFRDASAKEDEVKEEVFVPKAYMSAAAKTKRQPKKEKTAAKPAPVIQMPKAEPAPKEDQVSMFDLMGGMAG